MSLTGPVDLATVLLFAALNPVAVAVSIYMGSKASSKDKLLIAAFAGAVAGIAVLWLLAEMRIEAIAKPARAAGGIFVTGILTGLVWASVGYRFFRKQP